MSSNVNIKSSNVSESFLYKKHRAYKLGRLVISHGDKGQNSIFGLGSALVELESCMRYAITKVDSCR